MKNFLLLVIFTFLIVTNIFSQAPDWQWAHSAGGTNWDFGNDVATDNSGNVYVTGYFASDSIAFGSTVLTNAGSAPYEDIFLAKYDPTGSLLWVKKSGGTISDEGETVTTDAAGNVYLAGFFRSSSISFDAITLTLSGDYDIFLAKFDADGNAVWATSASTVDFNYGYDAANGISLDASGNIFLAGMFGASSITFGSFTLNNTSTDGTYDLFLVKFDSSGNPVWASSAAGSSYDGYLGAATDASGNVFVSGFFYSSLLALPNDTLYNSGSTTYSDLFIAKYDSDGNELWAHSSGGDNYDFGRDVAVDAAGNVYMTGEFYSGSITFGSITISNSYVSGYPDMFLAKYSSDGEALWVNKANALFDDYSSGVATNSSGDVFITGYFDYSMTIGNVTFTANNFSEDIFLAEYDTAGNFVTAMQATGNNADYSYKIAADNFGNAYLTGGFSSDTIHFGVHSAADVNYNAYTNEYDMCVAKFGSNNCANIYYADNDGDGFGDPNNSVLACDQPMGFVSNDSDCNDNQAGINPNATEVCNLIDDNCNGLIDEGVQLTYYADADGDGYGNPNVVIFGCEQPGGYVADSTDCDDTNPNIHPGAYDIPNNGIDEDCNGSDAVTGIASLDGAESLNIYPNPSDGKFVIELPSNVSGEALIQILNSLGQTVFEERAIEVSNAKIEMELNNKFSEGIYSLQVISGETKFRGRLVIGK